MAEDSEIFLYREDHKYKNIKQIGKRIGTFGEIHLVKNLKDEKEYAMKILKSNDKEDINSFDLEIKIYEDLNKKKNKYIPKIYDHGIGTVMRKKEILGKKHYLVIDHFKKGNLGYYIEKSQNGFKEKYAKIIFKKILKGIKYCHQNKICHLDIKPANILLDNNFNPKIIDFGFSDYFNEKDGIPKYNTRTRGTHRYACPEMYDKKKHHFSGVKADIFSLGVLMLNLVTNKYGFTFPIKGSNSYKYIIEEKYELFWSAVKANIVVDKLSKELKDLYIKMISNKPEKRPSIDEILEDPWMKEINDLKKDNNEKYKELKEELKSIFSGLQQEIKEDDEQIETKPKIEEREDKPIKKSFSENEELYFPLNMQPKKFDKDEFVNNFLIIKGYLNPAEFMHSLTKQMVEDFKDLDDYELYANASKNSLKLEASFELRGSYETEINSIDELKGTNCIIIISLVKEGEDEYIIQFVRKEGEIEDYYGFFLKIKEIIKKKLL